MHGPPLVGWLLVAVTGGTSLFCLLRMRGAGREERRAAGGEALMGLGMAVMAVPWAQPSAASGSRSLGPVLLAVFFTAAGLRSALLVRAPGRGVHRAHHAHHVVGAAAMVYMALAMMPTGGGHGGTAHGPAGVPALTGALLVYFAVSALCAAPRLIPAAGPVIAGLTWPLPVAAPAAPGPEALLDPAGVRDHPAASASASASADPAGTGRGPARCTDAGADTGTGARCRGTGGSRGPVPAGVPTGVPAEVRQGVCPPGIGAACQVAMAIGMFAMLLTL